LKEEIKKFSSGTNWDLIEDYHFGGYAKINRALIEFINKFKAEFKIPLDPIYTGKMLYGIFNMIQRNKFPKNAKILAIHTGGLQGVEGMNQKLRNKNWPQIV